MCGWAIEHNNIEHDNIEHDSNIEHTPRVSSLKATPGWFTPWSNKKFYFPTLSMSQVSWRNRISFLRYQEFSHVVSYLRNFRMTCSGKVDENLHWVEGNMNTILKHLIVLKYSFLSRNINQCEANQFIRNIGLVYNQQSVQRLDQDVNNTTNVF